MEVKSLTNLGQVAVATTIFTMDQSQRELQRLLNNSPGSDFHCRILIRSVNDVIKIGEKEIQQLIMPSLLKEEMKHIIISVSKEIVHWLVHFHQLGIRCDFSNIKEFCWTSGRIDGRKSAQRLLQKQRLNLDINVIFKVASMYCLYDEIKNIASQNIQYLKDLYIYYQSSDQQNIDLEEEMESLWCHDILEYEFPNEISVSVKPVDFIKLGKELGNIAAMTFFYDRIKFSSKDDEIEFIVKSLKDISLNWMENELWEIGSFPVSYRVSSFIFLLKKLDIDKLTQNFMEQPTLALYTVYKLLLYPFRHLFFKYAHIAIDFLKTEYNDIYYIPYCMLFRRIAEMMEQDFDFYNKAFNLIWERFGKSEVVLRGLLRTKDVMLNLLINGSFINAKLILNSASINERKLFIRRFIIHKSSESETRNDLYYNDASRGDSIVKILSEQPELEICKKFINSNFGLQYFNEPKKIKTKTPSTCPGDNYNNNDDNDLIRFWCITFSNRVAAAEKNKLITKLNDLVLFEKFSLFLIDFLLGY